MKYLYPVIWLLLSGIIWFAHFQSGMDAHIKLIVPAILLSLTLALAYKLSLNLSSDKPESKKDSFLLFFTKMDGSVEKYVCFAKRIFWIFLPLSFLSLFLADFDRVGRQVKYLLPISLLVVWIMEQYYQKRFREKGAEIVSVRKGKKR
jgi:hypothetical protein